MPFFRPIRGKQVETETALDWVAVKELKSSYHNREISLYIYTYSSSK